MDKFNMDMLKLTYLGLMMIMMIMLFMHIHKPMYTMIILIIYTSLMCLFMVLWSWKSLYSIIIFLMLISGMFTMFMYFASLINNELLLSHQHFITYTYISINFFALLILISKKFMDMSHPSSKPLSNINSFFNKTFNKNTIMNYMNSYYKNFEQNIYLNNANTLTSETMYMPIPSSPYDLSSSITMMYIKPWYYITLMCIILLLISLIMTIKICSIQNKSMRKMK